MITFQTSSGLKLAADSHGPTGAPHVLLLHGGGQTRHSWRQTGLTLAEAGYHVLALDARGHGDSGWAPDGDYALEALADDVAQVCHSLDRPIALVGASLGGLTSLIAAGEREGLECTALVLVDVIPLMSQQGGAEVKSFMFSRPDGFASLNEAADAVAAYLPNRPRPKHSRGLAKNLRAGSDGRLRWHWDPRFMAGARSANVNQGDRLDTALDGVTCPMLLVRGEESALVTDEYLELFRARHPQVEVAEVAGARHMVAGDLNDVFTAHIIQFLTRINAA